MDATVLHNEYEQVVPRAARLKDSLVSELGHLLAKNSIALGVPLESRVKAWASIEEKASRKPMDLRQITDLDDLIGIRIILLFRCDLESVDRLVRDSLSVLSAEDTATRLGETQFGYQSQHYVVTLPRAWLKLPSYADFSGLKVELQVRTLAQHIWAAASHKLQYKHESSVPLPLRRSIHRASALLETVDLEFDRLLQERRSYVEAQVKAPSTDEPINVDILKSVLAAELPDRNRSAEEPYDDLLVDLKHFGIDTANKLRTLLKRNLNASLASDADWAKRMKKERGFYFGKVGLTREALRIGLGGGVFSDYQIKAVKKKRTVGAVRKRPTTGKS